ncbi:MAG: phosphodiester glycosidase family protein [Brevirhabdus sp.]
MWRAVFLWFVMVTPVAALECRDMEHASNRYTICEVDPARDALRLWHSNDTGQVIGTFAQLKAMLARHGERLGFAMNAGMYHDDRSPVGLYIEDGIERRRIVTSAGPGNFGLLPNGVFCIGDGQAQVIESRRFAKSRPACRFATQSGPMLVIDGALHPRFLPDGTSRNIRNGVGVRADGSVVFAISDNTVNFHAFGVFFRDVLKTPNALYFDGRVSRLHAPQLGRSDGGFRMGPIVGVTVQD